MYILLLLMILLLIFLIYMYFMMFMFPFYRIYQFDTGIQNHSLNSHELIADMVTQLLVLVPHLLLSLLNVPSKLRFKGLVGNRLVSFFCGLFFILPFLPFNSVITRSFHLLFTVTLSFLNLFYT